MNTYYLPLESFAKRVLPALALVGFLSVCYLGFDYSTRRLSDFAGYYTASRLVVDNDSLSKMYDDAWFKKKVAALGIKEPTVVMYVNPPPASLIMLIVAWLGPFTAKVVWNVISVAFLVAVVIMSRRILKFPLQSGYTSLLVLLLGSSVPFLRNLQRGQVYLLMLFLVLLLWTGYERDDHWLSGIPLAILILLKYFGWVFLLFFLMERKWKHIGTTLLSLITLFSLSLLVFGATTYESHFERLMTALQNMDFATTGLPSVQALFGGLFVYDPLRNPYPVVDAHWLATLFTLLAMAVLVYRVLAAKVNIVTFSSRSKFLALLILSAIFTPLAADHHYILLALPLFVYLYTVDMKRLNSWQLFGIATIAYLLLGWLPIPPAYELEGWSKVLSFPRLYAALALLFLLYRKSVRSHLSEHDRRTAAG